MNSNNSFMKKKSILLFSAVFLFAISCILLIFNLTNETYTLNWLVENSDYAVVAQRNILKCEDIGKSHAIKSYKGEKPYKQNGKVYTEMYICCHCENFLGEKITIVTEGYYFSENDYSFIFLKCIDETNRVYAPVNDRTGVIKIRAGKLRPMDISLKSDVKSKFSDIGAFYDWFTDIGKQKILNKKEATKEIPTTAMPPSKTTAAPVINS